jgi:hypothetical protein
MLQASAGRNARSRSQRAALATLGVVYVCLWAHQATNAGDSDNATLYEITAELKLPARGDYQRYNLAHEKRCLTRWQLHQFFPVLSHPALAMCRLGEPSVVGDKLNYSLECVSEHFATGAIVWETHGQDLVGRLDARLTTSKTKFSQKVVAKPIEACFPYANYL